VIRQWLTFWGHLYIVYAKIASALFVVADSALCLALGHIFYISAVNDEVSQWKRPENATEEQVLKYRYGWAFYCAGSSFIFLMVTSGFTAATVNDDDDDDDDYDDTNNNSKHSKISCLSRRPDIQGTIVNR